MHDPTALARHQYKTVLDIPFITYTHWQSVVPLIKRLKNVFPYKPIQNFWKVSVGNVCFLAIQFQLNVTLYSQ